MSCTLNQYNVGDTVWAVVNEGYFRAQIVEILESEEEDSTENAVAYLITGIKDKHTKYGVIGDALVSFDDLALAEETAKKKAEVKQQKAIRNYESARQHEKQQAESKARRFIAFMRAQNKSWSSVSDVEEAIVSAFTQGYLEVSDRKIRDRQLFW